MRQIESYYLTTYDYVMRQIKSYYFIILLYTYMPIYSETN